MVGVSGRPPVGINREQVLGDVVAVPPMYSYKYDVEAPSTGDMHGRHEERYENNHVMGR